MLWTIDPAPVAWRITFPLVAATFGIGNAWLSPIAGFIFWSIRHKEELGLYTE